jgi:hypothetical protein
MDPSGGADNRLAIPAIASAAAAILHATAAGIHADHPDLSRLFVALAVAQAGAAIFGFVRPGRWAASALIVVNMFAAVGWVVTRLTGISWIDGLEVAERPQLADSISAAFAAIAVVGAVAALFERAPAVPTRAVTNAAILAGVLVVPGLVNATDHDHGSHEHSETAVDVHTDGHDHGTASTASAGETAAAGTAWKMLLAPPRMLTRSLAPKVPPPPE